ncbi:MAG TPA: XRE family transcriptional regulator [Tepidisphaeraceae bacterium]|jgi:SOS-response transcriptional repressor LexA|nr:XRE family transcriptional regulator [Tepidisphaeraceae bacterium]
METLGVKLRRKRLRLGLTLDELAGKTGISKPYLSLIETGRVMNPPSDEKLRRLEQALAFKAGELLTQAHLQRTPRDVRAVLNKLMSEGSRLGVRGSGSTGGDNGEVAPGVNLDDAYLSGVLQELVEKTAGNVEHVASNAAPVINRVSAGYPKDFTDLNYPKGVADEYVACPDLNDPQAFAARVHGDSMTPKYREGDIVIFSPAAMAKSGDDCFVRFGDGHTTFKRAFFEEDRGEAVIRLQPRNEKYRAQVVKSEEITGLYKAVFKYQRVDEE